MHAGHSKLHRLITGVLFVAAGMACTYGLGRLGLMAGVSRSLLDSLHRSTDATTSHEVVIVAINDDDYDHLFHKRSPLDPVRVIQLADAIQQFAPRVIGIDLDTADWPPSERAKAGTLPGGIVWARTFAPGKDPLTIESLHQVLGSENANVCFGLTGMQADSDYVIRQYPAEYRFGDQPILSFPMVVRALADDPQCPPNVHKAELEAKSEDNWDENRLLIRYRGEGHRIYHIPAGAVLATVKLAKGPPTNGAVERLRTLLGGRTVLLGGTYAAGRDVYPTPVGMLPGVDILAHTILSASEPKIGELRENEMLIFDASIGVGLLVLGLWHPRTSLVLGIAIMLLLVPISGSLFHSFGFFLNATPVLLGVMLHHLLHPLMEPKLERWFG